ncbi:ABC transporter substrate-binding protein [Bifidobacterium sp.]|uniref:ABC transporter substrate-binding protein n=1 Tax=Bifidobacterium sp. TaxID=41200 RepID=UPI0025C57BD9|nr:ABC transporter substrate-binding protein [Bifidobacterium sp.]MCH4209761.1 ABC transporter substrate-binding protein [Bifidobacterium sp.]MCI1224923.1 ABC transporter substrate-binding protein [Bifidobacterium sp.]
MTQHRKHDVAKRWGIFAAVAMALFAAIWLGWSLLNHQDVIPGIGPLQTNTTVTVGLRQAPASLDIRAQDGHAIDQALLGNVYETLVQRNQNNELEPGLAKTWNISKDALTYTFTLHSNLHFSNGNRLDAADVVWSLQQAIRHHYTGWNELGSLKSVQNPDPSTVVIALAKPNPTLLRALSWRPGIVYDSQSDIDYGDQALGSGPFIVSGYEAGRSITLKRNDSYWSGSAASSQVTLRYFSDDASLIKALHDGSVNMAVPSNPDLETSVDEDPTLKVVDGMSTSKVLLAYNGGTDSIFSDLHVRQATRYIIDSTALMRTQADAAQQLGGPISPLEPGYENLTGLFPYDVAKAQSMFSYFSTHYLGTLVFVVPQRYQSLGEAVTQQLQAHSRFNVQMQVVDDATLKSRMATGDYTMALLTMDGTDDAGLFADPKSPLRYENGAAQQQYAKAMAATSDSSYRKGMQAFARTVSQDAASDWLYTRKSRIVAKVKLSGYPKNMVDQLLLLKDLLTR